MFPEDVVVMGAGGHAKVCIDILLAMGKKVACCIGEEGSSPSCLGIRVLIGDDHLLELKRQGARFVFIAIGNNVLRSRLADYATSLGYSLLNAISPQAVISPFAKLGNGVAVMPGSIINAEVRIHDLAIINTGATIDHDCHIGPCAHIGPQCALAGCVTVGAYAFLGIGCKVIPEKYIGEKSIVGAGSVVIRDIPPAAKAFGVPANPVFLH